MSWVTNVFAHKAEPLDLFYELRRSNPYEENEEAIKAAVLSGADLNEWDSLGRTPLSYVASHGHVELIDFFVQHGADIHGRCKDQTTVLMHACSSGKIEAVDKVLSYKPDVFAMDDRGDTALFWAVTSCNKDVLDKMVRRGLHPKQKNFHGQIPSDLPRNDPWNDDGFANYIDHIPHKIHLEFEQQKKIFSNKMASATTKPLPRKKFGGFKK